MLEIEILRHELVNYAYVDHMAEMDPFLPNFLVYALLLQGVGFQLAVRFHQGFQAFGGFLSYFVDICELEHHNCLLFYQEMLDISEGRAPQEVVPVFKSI